LKLLQSQRKFGYQKSSWIDSSCSMRLHIHLLLEFIVFSSHRSGWHSTVTNLQKKGLSLDKVVTKLDSLKLFLEELRYILAERAVENALSTCADHQIDPEKMRFRRRMPGERARDEWFECSWRKQACLVAVYRPFLCGNFNANQRPEKHCWHFQCIQVNSLHSTEDELKVTVSKLMVFYNELIEPQLLEEIPRSRRHLKATKVSNGGKWNVLDIQFIVEFDLIETCFYGNWIFEAFPGNLCVSGITRKAKEVFRDWNWSKTKTKKGLHCLGQRLSFLVSVVYQKWFCKRYWLWRSHSPVTLSHLWNHENKLSGRFNFSVWVDFCLKMRTC